MKHRTCRDCQRLFLICDDEIGFLEERAREAGTDWSLPRRCLDCRRQRRRALYAVPVLDDGRSEQIACVVCGARFEFSAAEKTRYSREGHAKPKRCPACRAARRTA